MAYQYSQTDRRNLDWFEKDTSKCTLIRMKIAEDSWMEAFRGLRNLEVHFKYPITVISGRNGTGKSTLLACAACAYHNSKFSGFTPPYYKLTDFFVSSPEENSPLGKSIGYQFLHNYWRKTKANPSGTGLGWQYRNKNYFTGGKWNKYSSRLNRGVIYFGLERVVPHNEKKVLKSSHSKFEKFSLREKEVEFQKKTRETVGRILEKTYDEYESLYHSKHRIPYVKSKGLKYSGFNMGTGEKALFEIFTNIFLFEDNLFLVIDEIELGLHEEAQSRLIDELKTICDERHIQIICTTHSPRILNSLPPEARLHLEKEGDAVRVIPGISPEYAAGLMSGVRQAELDIVCEDRFAQKTLSFSLPKEIRERVEIIPIGSAAAVARYMAFRLKDKKPRAVCCFLDGDKSAKKQEHIKIFLNTLEQTNNRNQDEQWIKQRLAFLPSTTNPEKWVISKHSKGAFKKLAKEFGVSVGVLGGYIENAQLADSHNLFIELSKRLHLSEEFVESRFIQCAVGKSKSEVGKIIKHVQHFLN
jgi:predicted ATPase